MRYILPLVLALFLAVPAYAAFDGPGTKSGGFQGPMSGANTTNVTQAKQLGDNVIVTLTGHITSKLVGSKDKYMFKDDSGEIIVEIDDKYFRGQHVTPENIVRISGKVDKDFGQEVEIDVKYLELVK